MKQPPEILYLQWDKLGDGADTSWTDVIQDDDDIIYIRKLISDISVVKLEQDVRMRDRAITRQSEEITTLKLEICKLLNYNSNLQYRLDEIAEKKERANTSLYTD